MPSKHEITGLLELERDDERRFAGCLTAAERGAQGTPDRPSPKDAFAHAVGAKVRMHEALVSVRTGADPDSSHDRIELFQTYADRSFESLEEDAARVADAIVRDVEALDADMLNSSPAWIGEATLADEIVQQCVTHALVLMFESLCARGDVDDALRAQRRFVAALPPDLSPLQRSRALYNLGCLCVRAGRDDEAVESVAQALRLRPSLVDHVRTDPELERVRSRLLP